MRKIVTIKRIEKISPIVGADSIETAKIGGWNSVVKKNEFHEGEFILYFEVDSFLPIHIEEFSFLSSRGTKTVISPLTHEEVTGHILRSMKLRGVISQGLIMPLIHGLTENSTQEEIDEIITRMGIFKYEAPIPMSGNIIGSFPFEASKTDSERVQNLSDEFLQSLNSDDWFATEKIDGTSSTFVKRNGKIIVASRNWELDFNDSLQGETASLLHLDEIMPEGSIIQGEIFGEGIQNNPLKIPGRRLLIFHSSTPVDSDIFNNFVKDNSVPMRRDFVFPRTVDEAVTQVFKMRSFVNPKVQTEGIVWWNKNGELFNELGNRPNFKAINNDFLLKNHG